MPISATYINDSQFSVSGNQEDEFPVNRVVECDQGVDGFLYVVVTASQYNGGSDETTVVVAPDSLTSNLTLVEKSTGGWGGALGGGNIGPHTHTDTVGDGGEIDAAGMSSAEVTNAQRLPTPSAGEDLYILRYEHATQNFELFQIVGSANQILGTNAAGDDLEAKTISGTANQINVSHGANNVALSAPQDIHTAATPIFAGLSLTGLTGLLNSAGASGVSVITIGSSLQFLRVDSGGTGHEYITLSTSHLDDFNLSNPGAGDILYYDGSDWVGLDSDTASDGDVLTWDNGNIKPKWSAASGGGSGASTGFVIAMSMMGMAASSG